MSVLKSSSGKISLNIEDAAYFKQKGEILIPFCEENKEEHYFLDLSFRRDGFILKNSMKQLLRNSIVKESGLSRLYKDAKKFLFSKVVKVKLSNKGDDLLSKNISNIIMEKYKVDIFSSESETRCSIHEICVGEKVEYAIKINSFLLWPDSLSINEIMKGETTLQTFTFGNCPENNLLKAEGVIFASDIHLKETNFQDAFEKFKKMDLELRRNKKSLKNMCLVVCGDVTNNGRENEFLRVAYLFKKLQKAEIVDISKIFVLPGNHDCYWMLGNGGLKMEKWFFFSQTFYSTHDARELFPIVRKVGSKKLVLMNSCNVKESGILPSAMFCGGKLGERQLKKLEEEIKTVEKGEKIIVAFHHPVCNTNGDIDWMYTGGIEGCLDDRKTLNNLLLDNSECILVVVFGHIHKRYSTSRTRELYFGGKKETVKYYSIGKLCESTNDLGETFLVVFGE